MAPLPSRAVMRPRTTKDASLLEAVGWPVAIFLAGAGMAVPLISLLGGWC